MKSFIKLHVVHLECEFTRGLMPRSARALADNCCYHLINRGNGRQQVFHKEGDYQAFLGVLQGARQRYSVKVLAWCLMPNHFHLLVQPEDASQLNKWMQWVMTTHVRRYHKHYGSSGHLWQGRYKSFIVQEAIRGQAPN